MNIYAGHGSVISSSFFFPLHIVHQSNLFLHYIYVLGIFRLKIEEGLMRMNFTVERESKTHYKELIGRELLVPNFIAKHRKTDKVGI